VKERLIVAAGAGRLGRVIVARPAPGADLLAAIEDLVRREQVQAGVLLCGVGFLSRVAFRNVKHVPDLPIRDEDRVVVRREGPFELLSTSGSVAMRGAEPSVHAHISVSSGEEAGVAYGGHLIEGCIVYHLAELVIAELEDVSLAREYDPETRSEQLAIRRV
jgi:hypothetical protein